MSKIILAGEVKHEGVKKPVIMIYDYKKEDIEQMKVLELENVTISSLNFGPFDNGHIMIGLTNGELLAFDVLTLKRLENTLIFTDLSPITSITFDPTHTIFVGGSNGKIVSLSPLSRAKNYLYVDMGD